MSVVCLGELLIDFVSLETGVSVGDASGFQKAPGGAPANVAVALARLGHQSVFLGQVGDDPFGHYLAGVLKQEGVDIRGLRFSADARTALAFVSLRADGERSFVFYRHPSADMLLRPGDLPLDLLDHQSIFHFGSITLIGNPVRSATLGALQYAQSRDLLISYDPNLRLALWPDADAARDGMRLGMEYAQIVKVSAEELEFLTGGDDPRALWYDATELLIVTRGAEGASAYHRSGLEVHVPGHVVEAVDTTGGRGCVCGGLVTWDFDAWTRRLCGEVAGNALFCECRGRTHHHDPRRDPCLTPP